jgi:heme oxygenase (mycobilin-producing)
MSEQPVKSGPVVFINVFDIAAADLDAFTAQWEQRAEMMRAKPGFRAFHLYRALSTQARFQLVNVAEWDSEEAVKAATSDERFQASIQQSAAQFDVSAFPAVYRAVLAAEA